MSKDIDDVRRISTAAVKAAEAEFAGEPYAVVVIVRKLPWGGMPVNVGTNITTGVEHVLGIIDEGRNAVRKPRGS